MLALYRIARKIACMHADITSWLVALGTLALAIVAFFQILESRRTLDRQIIESREAAGKQLGVQTWLVLEPRFDAVEMKRSRMKLAKQLDPYNRDKHDEISEEVLEFFESVGTVYNLGLLDKSLAVSSFSFHANYWWAAAQPYIQHERRRHGDDDSLFSEFQKFVEKMREHDRNIDADALRVFLADEKRLIKE